MTRYLQVLFLFICSSNIYAKNEIYLGNRVYKLKFENQTQQDKLGLLKNDNINFWRNPSFKYNTEGLAMVPEAEVEWFEERLLQLKCPKNVVIEDVFTLLQLKEIDLSKSYGHALGERTFDFDGYYRYDEIINHLVNLEDAYNITDVEQAGTTAEGRDLVYVKISTTEFNEPKPIIVIEAGSSPKEWITIPAAINIIHQLYEDDNVDLIDNVDWIIIPVLNPDGYEYSHTNLRFWEKNRSTKSNMGIICPGVNVNRNFDMQWLAEGASSSPCSNIYAGIEQFSEEESKFVKDIFDEYQERISLYISIHNDGSFISYPWNYERAASGMFRQHHLLGLDMMNESNLTGSYSIDIGSITFGERVSGTSTDFMHYNGVLYTFNIGVAQEEDLGVLIPEENIRRSITPVWTAISTAAKYVIEKNI